MCSLISVCLFGVHVRWKSLTKAAAKFMSFKSGTGGGPDIWADEMKERRRELLDGVGCFTYQVFENTVALMQLLKMSAVPQVGCLIGTSLLPCVIERKERKTAQAAKSSSHQLRKRGHLGRKAPSTEVCDRLGTT